MDNNLAREAEKTAGADNPEKWTLLQG